MDLDHGWSIAEDMDISRLKHVSMGELAYFQNLYRKQDF